MMVGVMVMALSIIVMESIVVITAPAIHRAYANVWRHMWEINVNTIGPDTMSSAEKSNANAAMETNTNTTEETKANTTVKTNCNTAKETND